MKKKEVVLVFGITRNYVFALANTLIGLVKHNKKFWDDIIVYYDELSGNDMELLNKITPINFEKFGDIKELKNVSSSLLEVYSVAAFYRFECFNLLKKYKKVIWNDVDILITGDISGLLEYGNKSGFSATLSNANAFVETNFNGLIDEYDMLRTCYNSGILVLSDKLEKYDEMASWCFKTTERYAEKLRWLDQGVINLLLQEFNIDVENIDILKYCCHPTLLQYKDEAKIIHAYGEQKFWNDKSYKEIYKEWLDNEQEWNNICNQSKIKYQEPLVSCIMTTYKRNEFLDEALRSVLSQTYKNIEIIFVIEYSNEQEVIEKQLKNYNDKRIKIIKNKEKLGLAKSLNVAIDNSKGKYLARMDDDDISLPKRFEKQVMFLESNLDIGICGTAAEIFGKHTGTISVEIDPDKLKAITLVKTPFVHPSVMIRKEYIDKYNLRYNPDFFSEDYELWSRCIKFFKIANLNEKLLRYRSSDSALTSSGVNEEKIHSSHLKIMKNQFKNYLNYDAKRDELDLIQGRKEILNYCNNKDELLKLRSEFIKKVIKLNKKTDFYKEDYLKKILNNNQITESEFKNNIIIKILKKILKPFYSRLLFRIESIIDYREYMMELKVNKKINEINSKIEIIEKDLNN